MLVSCDCHDFSVKGYRINLVYVPKTSDVIFDVRGVLVFFD